MSKEPLSVCDMVDCLAETLWEVVLQICVDRVVGPGKRTGGEWF